MAQQIIKVDLLLQELKNVEWDTLGTHLGLSQSEIKDIERDHQNTGRRRIMMFDLWLRKEENPSWVNIIAALVEMSETRLASQLRKKYQLTSRVTSEDLELAVQQARVLMVDRKAQVARELDAQNIAKDGYAPSIECRQL